MGTSTAALARVATGTAAPPSSLPPDLPPSIARIDYSQYRAWMKCPWFWYERYVNGVEKLRPNAGYRNDALALGSLVHAGLEGWGNSRSVGIPETTVAEIGPSPETLQVALGMVAAYARKFPSEEFPTELTETPVTFPLPVYGIEGFALIDNYFEVRTPTVIDVGLSGEQFVLEPGWWIREYKTKDEAKPRDTYAAGWACNMQANFQLLGLRNRLPGEKVNGLFVCVLEKPRVYIPKRKCKGCGETIELSLFYSTGEGHACPLCGHKQLVTPYKPKASRAEPQIYRLKVQRTEDQLATAKREITQVAEAMQEARQTGYGLDGVDSPPSREICVWGNSVCEFFDNHTYNRPTDGDPSFVKRDTHAYMRQEKLIQILTETIQ
jgi:hypothetical protein